MIYLNLDGGLGNQMFQYAFARSLTLKYKTELFFIEKLLNKKIKNNQISRSFELDVFNIKKSKVKLTNLKKTIFFFYNLFNILLVKFGFKNLQTSNYFVERNFSYNKGINKIKKDCFLSGYWQSPLYFQSVESIIRKDFIFPQIKESTNIEILKKIKKTNSVSIHVRRGDFLNTKDHGIHGVCSLRYYENAISYILSNTEKPVFFIFSDDQEWVKQNFNLVSNYYFVEGNTGKKSYLDMHLMSECKHNIIANSSFSWWGAWLNSNNEKIIIAPDKWFSNKTFNIQTNDLIPKNWIRI